MSDDQTDLFDFLERDLSAPPPPSPLSPQERAEAVKIADKLSRGVITDPHALSLMMRYDHIRWRLIIQAAVQLAQERPPLP